MESFDVVIVGGGPAGLNAALVLARSRRRVLVCDSGRYRNGASHALHNFVSRDGIDPADLLRAGREELARYGATYRQVTVTNACCVEGGIEVELEGGISVRARKLLLATGMIDVLPPLAGAQEFYGRGVFHCPYCDGWEMQDRGLAAYGAARDAVSLARVLLGWSSDVVVCTDGAAPPNRRERAELRRLGIRQRTEKIVRLEGEANRLQQIVFESGPPLERDALFFTTGDGQRSLIPERLGCRFNRHGRVETDRRGRTGVRDVFLAGDASGDVQLAIVAAAEGAKAGIAINHELQEESLKKVTVTLSQPR